MAHQAASKPSRDATAGTPLEGGPGEAPSGDAEMTRLVAELYYMRDQSQSTIADLTGFSISKVSRLLAQARAAGIVRITVEPGPDQLASRAERLAAAMGVSDAHVTPGRSDDPARATRLCAVAAATWVASQIPDAGVLGMAGGYTMAALVDALPSRRCAHLTIVPLVGGWDPATPHLDINELVRRTADRFQARYQLLHAPGRLDSVAVKEALLADSAIRVTTELWDRLTLAVIGVSGSPLEAPGYTTVMDQLDDAERRRLTRRGVVGDIMGHLFSAAGEIVEDPTTDRTMAAPIDALRRAARVIAIAAGPHKVQGIIGACRTRLVHTLVTDQPTAEEITRRLA